MNSKRLGMAGTALLITLAPWGPAWAQAPAGEPSMGCRLFPLACPGPVPAPPPPLLGTPEERAAAEAPPPPEPHAKHRRRKHTSAKAAAQ